MQTQSTVHNCLVTGGAGFIGSHIVDRLVADGHKVWIVDNESATANDKFWWNEAAVHLVTDITDCQNTNLAELVGNVDTVFHCAAEARIQPSFDNPQLVYRTNTLGTAGLLNLATSSGSKVRWFVNSSTSSLYPSADHQRPTDETVQSEPRTPYALSKLTAEQLCSLPWGNLTVTTLRYFNVYGDRSPTKGAYAPVVGKFIEQVKCGAAPTVVGTGKQSRDFTHVSDVVEANLLAAWAPRKEHCTVNKNNVYNIGTGNSVGLLDLAQLVNETFGTRNLVEFLPTRPMEVERTWADNRKAARVFGWQPKVQICDWVRQQKK